MTKKFNSKQYHGKDRVYPAIPGAPNVRRLWVWDAHAQEYRAPEQGKCYEARRYEFDPAHGRVRRKRYFDSLEQARNWQAGLQEKTPATKPEQVERGMLFQDLVIEWRNRVFPTLAESTRVAYDKILKLYMGSLFGLGVYELTPKRIDLWLDELKDPRGRAMQSVRRKRFSHELELLSTILKYYVNYHDDEAFQFPIKQRHRDAIELNRGHAPKPKDLSPEEFFRFRAELLKGSYGTVMAAMATVQYFQALRISEAAALHWEDVAVDIERPRDSRLRVVRAVCWPRKVGRPSFVKGGFKNSGANDGIKEQPLFRPSFHALAAIQGPSPKGLIFGVDGKHLEYRQIQYAYDSAFKRAGLPYTGTHVMRHGGCRNLYNQVPDTAVAQQLLGNSTLQSTLVYAKRHASALTKVAEGDWENWEQEERVWSQLVAGPVTSSETSMIQEE